LDGYIETIKIISLNLPKDLVAEFDKVLHNIFRVKNKDKEFEKRFTFSKKSDIKFGFNYERLEQYLLNELGVNRNVIWV
jgi:hypothetical protein